MKGLVMRHLRITSTLALPYLKDYLNPDDDIDKDVYLEKLAHLLVYQPQQIWIAASFDDLDVIQGFCIAYAPSEFKFVSVVQVWVGDADKPQGLLNLYHARLKAWSESLGRFKLRLESKNDQLNLSERWGFSELSRTYELDLEVSDGISRLDIRRGETQDNQHVDEPTTVVGECVDGATGSGDSGTEVQSAVSADVAGKQVGDGSDSLPRPDSAGLDGSVRAGSGTDLRVQPESVQPTEQPVDGSVQQPVEQPTSV